MDGSRFDSLVRALGASRTRRGALGLLAGLAAGAATGEAGAKRRRKRCKPACGAAQACVKGECVCAGSGAVCGLNCCLIGQECRDGQCVELPEPVTCIAFGEACKNAGRPCCDGLVCGSGQGGENDVACYVRKTGRCTATAECTYGTECVDGACVGLPVCTVQLGEPCTPADICCTGTCGQVAEIGSRDFVTTDACCVGLGQACARSIDCCQRGQVTGDRSSRISVIVCDRGVCQYQI